MTRRQVLVAVGIVLAVAVVAVLVLTIRGLLEPLPEPVRPVTLPSGTVLDVAERQDAEIVENAATELQVVRNEIEQVAAPAADLDARSTAISDLLNRRLQ